MTAQPPPAGCPCGVAGCVRRAIAEEVDRLLEEAAAGVPDPDDGAPWWQR